ncbi:hypothetical protein ACFL54_05640 [Planctomycetota bacterium]
MMKTAIFVVIFAALSFAGGYYVGEINRKADTAKFQHEVASIRKKQQVTEKKAQEFKADAEVLKVEADKAAELNSKISTLEQQLIKLTEERDQARDDLAGMGQELEKARQAIVQLQQEKIALAEDRDNAMKQLDEAIATDVASSKSDKKDSDMGEMFKNIADNPEMMKMIREQQKPVIKMMFGDLWEKLNLSEEDEEELMDILLNRQMLNVDLGMKLMGGKLSDEEKELITEQLKQAQEEARAVIQNFLGDGNYPVFQDYEATLGERMIVTQFSSGLTEPLDSTRKEQIIQVMNDEKKNYNFVTSFGDQNNMDMSRFSKKNVTKYFEEKAELDLKIADKVKPFLSEEEHEKFIAQQAQQRSMEEMGIRMAQQMFGGNDDNSDNGGNGGG